MQLFTIPGWIWINLALLVAAAVLVCVKLATGKTGRKPVAGNIRRAGN